MLLFAKFSKWDGGYVALQAGGGHKINLLKEGLKQRGLIHVHRQVNKKSTIESYK